MKVYILLWCLGLLAHLCAAKEFHVDEAERHQLKYLYNNLSSSLYSPTIRDLVKGMFYHAYDNYMLHAFPMDELRPASCGGEDSLGG